jgi:transposase IS66 family protein
VSPLAAQKRARLQTIVTERAAWSEPLAQVKRMHQWVLEVEHILDGSGAQTGEEVSNATVGKRLDAWRERMAAQLTDGSLSELEQECLTQFLQQLSNLRPYLVQCYDREGFPRTNNEMERSIRALKTRYRRISGRKNWNAYLLRYGRSVAYYEWWEQDAARRQQLVEQASRLDRARWHQMRRETTAAQHEQLTRFRFRHRRQAYLASLEDRWAAAAPT